eukprot:gene8405-5886_t
MLHDFLVFSGHPLQRTQSNRLHLINCCPTPVMNTLLFPGPFCFCRNSVDFILMSGREPQSKAGTDPYLYIKDDLTSLSKVIDTLDNKMNHAMVSVQALLLSMDEMGKSYAQLSHVCAPEVHDRMKSFHQQMRTLKDSNVYALFTEEYTTKVMHTFKAMRDDLSKVQDAAAPLQKAASLFIAASAKEQKKKDELEKGKKNPSVDPTYQKIVAEKEKAEGEYLKAKESFIASPFDAFQKKMDTKVKQSTSFCNTSISTLFDHLMQLLKPFGSDERPIQLSRIRTEKEISDREKAVWAATGLGDPEMTARERSFPQPSKNPLQSLFFVQTNFALKILAGSVLMCVCVYFPACLLLSPSRLHMPKPYIKSGKGKGICKFFQQGKCSNKRCPYLHVKGTTERSTEDSASSQILSTMLKLFLEKQRHNVFSEESCALNLSNLTEYEDLQNISSSINLNNRIFCMALCKSIKDVIVPPPVIYRFENDNIKSVLQLVECLKETSLHETIQAVSFAGNRIESLEVADHLKHLTRLREINLEGNPVTGNPEYKNRFRKSIPSLTSIDRESIRAPLLNLPWPAFYTPYDAPLPAESPHTIHTYSPLQSNIIQFIQSSIIAPMEGNNSVDAVSDVYSCSALLTLSFESSAAVSTGTSNGSVQRDMVREIVALRLRQNDSNHNILLGLKPTIVASGRTSVCATLEQCVYPKNFSVSHLVHHNIDVSVLDNHNVQNTDFLLAEPVSVVTLHGILSWTYAPQVTTLASNLLIRRNFSRVLVVTTADSGRWHVTNDLISLYPLNISMSGAVLPDILYTPAEDRHLIVRFARLFNVPEPVVATLARSSASDAHLGSILVDLSDIPIWQYEHAASLFNGDPMASIMLCRLHKRHGLDEQKGMQLIHQFGLNWDALEGALLTNKLIFSISTKNEATALYAR